ncbi:hypothetical protein PENTCL1PPCAC_4303, partial [Pristionchus entomophagus]
FDVFMVGSFVTGITLALLTLHLLSHAHYFVASPSSIALQRKLLIAHCAQISSVFQTFVPLVFVYIPFMGVNHAAFLNLPVLSIDSFPAWDAILIISVIGDYRAGLLSLIMPKKPTPATVPMSFMTTEASTAIV